MFRLRPAALSLLLTLLLAPAGHAAPFSQLVIFGDSLSYDGEGPAEPPTYGGRLSNGPIWAEQLAARFGLAGSAYRNDAVGGAKTDGTNAIPGGPGLRTQVDVFLAAPPPLAGDALFAVWAGGNDGLLAPPAGDPGLAARSAGNVMTALDLLADAGARRFLVPNLPDLGRVPLASLLSGGGDVTRFSAFTEDFNAALSSGLDAFEAARGVSVLRLDVAAEFEALLADPERFGLEETRKACTNLFEPGVRCDNPDAYLFWDQVHPSTRVHGLLAERAAGMLVPEPASGLLVALGLASLSARRRLRPNPHMSASRAYAHRSPSDATARVADEPPRAGTIGRHAGQAAAATRPPGRPQGDLRAPSRPRRARSSTAAATNASTPASER